MEDVGGDGRLREGGRWVEWSEERYRITQKSKTKIEDGWIRSMCLEEFLWKMMKTSEGGGENKEWLWWMEWKVVIGYEVFVSSWSTFSA